MWLDATRQMLPCQSFSHMNIIAKLMHIFCFYLVLSVWLINTWSRKCILLLLLFYRWLLSLLSCNLISFIGKIHTFVRQKQTGMYRFFFNWETKVPCNFLSLLAGNSVAWPIILSIIDFFLIRFIFVGSCILSS